MKALFILLVSSLPLFGQWNDLIGLSAFTSATFTNAPPAAFTNYYSTAFDGNDAVTKTNLTGASQSKVGVVSLWVRFNAGADGQFQMLFSSLNPGKTIAPMIIRKSAADQLAFQLFNSAGTPLLRFYTDATYGSASNWMHVFFSWDLANTTYTFKINGVTPPVTVETSPVDDFVQNESGQHYLVGDYDGSYRLNGLLSEVYFTTAYVSDVSKFYSAAKPVNLGADGSTPTGSQPLVYLHNDYSSFQNNLGSGGNFAVSAGALADGGTNKP